MQNIQTAAYIASNLPPQVVAQAIASQIPSSSSQPTSTTQQQPQKPAKLSEKHAGSLVPADQAKIIPWAEMQAEKMTMLTGRLRSWNVCLDEIHKSVLRIIEIENAMGMEWNRLSSVFTADSREVAGSSTHMNTVRDSISRLGSEHTGLVDFMNKVTLQRIVKLTKSWQSFAKQVADRIDTEFANVEKTRAALVVAVQHHAVNNLQGRETPSGDPWLTEQTLRNAVQKSLAAEDQYGRTMNDVCVKFASQEAGVVEELKTLFGEFRMFDKKKLTNLANHYDLLGTFVTNLQPSIPFSEFNSRHQVTNPALWMETRKIESLPVKLKFTTNVKKEGQLQVLRPGRFWSTTWKDLYCVVTDSGWFHAFDNSKSVFSAVLNTAQAAVSGQAVKQLSERRYEQLDNLETSFSLQLTDPSRVFAGIPSGQQSEKILKSQQEHLFEIIVTERAIGARDEPPIPGAPSQPGETRYQLKAPTEEEMVDWIVVVQEVLRQPPKRMHVPVVQDAVDMVSGRMNDRDVFSKEVGQTTASDSQLEALHGVLKTKEEMIPSKPLVQQIPSKPAVDDWANFETLSLEDKTKVQEPFDPFGLVGDDTSPSMAPPPSNQSWNAFGTDSLSRKNPWDSPTTGEKPDLL